ncbi:MAG TPA: Ig domain-containing protein, partial [Bryobacteraceae bacterium]|nr:Ig domain-containing protein [Bryobacteraceae bacterium]
MSFSHRLCQLGVLAALLGVAPLWSQDATAAFSCPASAAAGALVNCTVTLTPSNGVTITYMDFHIIITPNASSAAVDGNSSNADCCVNWADSGNLKNNTRTINASTQFPPDNTDLVIYWAPSSGTITGFPTLGTFSWFMPSAATAPASYTLSFQTALANNGNTSLNVATNTATVSLATVLNISGPASLAAATEGAAYSQTIVASGGTPSYSWSVNAGSLPAGLSIGPTTGIISGTPTAAGTFNNITVTVKDSANPKASVNKTYSLLVNPPITAVAPATLPGGTVGSAYTSGNISVTGGTPPYMFSTSANLAGIGLALTPVAPTTGTVAVISGTPTSGVSNMSIPITVTDANGATGQGSVKLTITGIGITSPAPGALPNGTVGLIYDGPSGVSLTAAGGTGAVTWTISSGLLPAGLTLGSTGNNNTTGTITGTPTATTTVPGPSFTVKATDSNNISATASYTITVYAAPSLNAPANLNPADVGSAY